LISSSLIKKIFSTTIISLILVACGGGSSDDENKSPNAVFTATPDTGVIPLTINFDASTSSDPDGSITNFSWDFGDNSSDTGKIKSHTYTIAGQYTVTLTVTDNSGATSIATKLINATAGVNNTPKASFSTDRVSGEAPVSINFDASNSSDIDGNVVSFIWDFGDGQSADGKQVQHSYSTPGTYIAKLTVLDNAGANAEISKNIVVRAVGDPPANPKTVAPPIDKNVDTTLFSNTKFLYSGIDPIQTGVSEGIIKEKRVAILRGKITDRDLNVIDNVRINILGHPEFGETKSREDGVFDIAVNGGSLLTINYEKEGYLAAQRQLNVPWKDFVWSSNVVLVPVDQVVTTVDLNSAGMKVARGSQVTDDDGTRQSTLLVPEGSIANLVMPDGSKQSISTLNIRTTEYTVGETGPAAMPAELPATSGYTYAFELSADEAMNAGAASVEFDSILYHYVEDFIGFDVGSTVPSGYYDRVQGKWIASKNGVVIKILSVTGGAVTVDSDGDNVADDANQLTALGFTNTELQQLATLYAEDQILWRVPITHFTPWDHNWPYGPPSGSGGPPGGNRGDDDDSDEEDACDCVIEYQTQVLRERIPLTGVPFSLNYRSDRVPGRKSAYSTDIILSDDTVPDPLKRIDLQIAIAGQQIQEQFSALPNQNYQFTWDGKDAYDRKIQGAQTATIKVGFVFDAIYQTASELEESFGRYSGEGVDINGNRSRQEITFWQEYKITLGTWDSSAQGLGGWSIDVNHVYDLADNVLYRGDGTRNSRAALQAVLTTVAGGSNLDYEDGMAATDLYLNGQNIEAAPDGGFYVSTLSNIFYVDPEGAAHLYAGKWRSGPGFSGDGGPATDALVENILGMALGPDGSLYFADVRNNRVRKVTPDGIIQTVAGDGTISTDFPPEEGVLATETPVYSPLDVAIAPDGGIYIAQWIGGYIRHVGPDGLISTVAGGQSWGSFDDEVPATDIYLAPRDIELGPDGSVYTFSNNRVWKITPDGIAHIIAGTGSGEIAQDGFPAKDAPIGDPEGIEVGADGSVYLAYSANYGNVIRRINPDGILNTIAGNGEYGQRDYEFEGAPALAAGMSYPHDISITADNEILIVDNYHIHKISPTVPGFSIDEYLVPSESGKEIYVFNQYGHHLKTHDINSGNLVYQFDYNEDKRLTSLHDAYDNVTTFERGGAGELLAIVGPYGHRTNIGLDSNNYISSIMNPEGNSWEMTYSSDGLLASISDPNNQSFEFTYDTVGRIIKDDEPNNGLFELTRTELENGFEVSVNTAENRNTLLRVENLADNTIKRTNTFPDGTANILIYGRSGSQSFTQADGTQVFSQLGPDPRFGMMSPLLESYQKITPNGLIMNYSTARSASLNETNNLLHPEALQSTQTINGVTYTKSFNATENTITRTTPEGREMITVLNDKSRPIEYRFNGLASYYLDYDDNGRLSQITRGSGDTARDYGLAYNVDGFVESVTDPLGQISSYSYDLLGRISDITQPGGEQTLFDFDKRGNLTGLTPAGQPVHMFSYNEVNDLIEYDPPEIDGIANLTSLDYNRDRQLTAINRPGGRTVSLTYDEGGRLASTILSDRTISYQYHEDTGSLIQATAPVGNVSFEYDGSLITKMRWDGTITGTLIQTHDNFFRITSRSLDDEAAIVYGYDGDGLLENVGAISITRSDENGLIESTKLDNIGDNWMYNEFGDLSNYAITVGTNPLFEMDYEFDKLGRITQIQETYNSTTINFDYEYSASGRLLSVAKNGAAFSTYTYDDNGNRLTVTDNTGSTHNSTYDDQDRLISRETINFSYHPDGSLIGKVIGSESTSYSYDALGNLLSVTKANGDVIDYLVDGRNRRIGKLVNDSLVQGLLYKDKLNPIAELNAAGDVISRFIYATKSNVPDYMIRDGISYRIISDNNGSPRFVVNSETGEVAQRLVYDVFGSVLEDSNPGFQPFGFAGGIYDIDTKLVRFGARDYDPESGRFTSQDPRYFCGRCTNLYSYVNNDPVNSEDPTGLGEGDCGDPSDDCSGREANQRDRDRERQSWRRSRFDFSIPSWLDSVIGTTGAVLGTASEVAATTMSAASAAIGVIVYPIAFEGARQTADTLATELIDEPNAQREHELDELTREIFRGSDRGGSDCP